MILLLQLSGPDGPVTAIWIHGRSPHLHSVKRELTRTAVSARRTDVVTRPVIFAGWIQVPIMTWFEDPSPTIGFSVNGWASSDDKKIQQNLTGWSENHYSQQIMAHAFHCLVCCYWIAQNNRYPIQNTRLFAKIKSRIPSLWQIACVVKTRLQLSPSRDFVILIVTK